MQNLNIVMFKGKKNGITIVLDENCSFLDIKTVLAEKVVDAKRFFSDSKAAIGFSGRSLTDFQETELLNIIAQKTDLNISFVSEDLFKVEPRKNDQKLHIEDDFSPETAKTPKNEEEAYEFTEKLYHPEHITRFHTSSLRSGQSIRFSGSVVVLGDVNPGAEIIAEGNIIVLGAAKGLLHAGCDGDIECFVSANVMKPVQLRIGDLITCMPQVSPKSKQKDEFLEPCFAYVKDKQIFIAPLVNK